MLLEVKDLSFSYAYKEHFYNKSQILNVFENINFSLNYGDKLSLQGPNGCGKTTLIKQLAMLSKIQQGDILFEGKSLKNLTFSEKLSFRDEIILIMQNQKACLNPYKNIQWHFDLIKKHFNKSLDLKLLDEFYLNPEILNKYPDQISGGQAQIIGLIRGLIISPKLLMLDEIDAGMDSKVLEICINKLKTYQGSLVFISHDEENLKQVCDFRFFFK